MVIILKRRLIDELMTTYLPTILILTIVYATNFFKPFFFEVINSSAATLLLGMSLLPLQVMFLPSPFFGEAHLILIEVRQQTF